MGSREGLTTMGVTALAASVVWIGWLWWFLRSRELRVRASKHVRKSRKTDFSVSPPFRRPRSKNTGWIQWH